MLLRLKLFLRSLLHHVPFNLDRPYIRARVRKALALHHRARAARPDGLELKRLSTTLEVEWIAREVHPWDRHRAAMSVQKLYTVQCLTDTQTAIERLFHELPDVETVELRVFGSVAEFPLLAGVVQRKDLRRAVYNSPGMNLKSLGVSFKLSDWRLEPMPSVKEHAEAKQARG